MKATVLNLPKEPGLFAFLGASMFYRDALNGLYVFGGIYAAGVLGWGAFELGVFGIIAAFSGAIGAWAGGRADRRFGPKPVILIAIVALILVSALSISTGPREVLYMDLGTDEFSLPSLVFFGCGAVIGAAGGALQSASRTMLILQAVPERMTEAFGIYALAGKSTSFLAPLLIGIVTSMSESQRIGVTPVIFLFILGLVLMAWVGRKGRE